MKITIKPLGVEDIEPLWQLAFGGEDHEWMNWNGPYFNDPVLTLAQFKTEIQPADQMTQGIWVDEALVGAVFAYFEDGSIQRWLEVGIVVYAAKSWQHGIGTAALKIWLTKVFQMTDLPHIGLTTWSGNQRMLHVAAKLGLREEARIRKVRFWQDQYWDSVKYGVLREEWVQK